MPEALSLVSWVLWILSFRLGTLFICGRLCFNWKWPFIHNFSEITLDKREEILRNWSREKRWVPLRIVFLLIKLAFFYTFFSRVSFKIEIFNCRSRFLASSCHSFLIIINWLKKDFLVTWKTISIHFTNRHTFSKVWLMALMYEIMMLSLTNHFNRWVICKTYH